MMKPQNIDWPTCYFVWLLTWFVTAGALLWFWFSGPHARAWNALLLILVSPLSPIAISFALAAGTVSKRRSATMQNAKRAATGFTCGRCGVALRIDEPHAQYDRLSVCDTCANHLGLTPARPTAL